MQLKNKKKKIFFMKLKNFLKKNQYWGFVWECKFYQKKVLKNKKTKGLALISGVVDKIYEKQKESHVGWNNLKIIKKNSILFNKIEEKSDFYFVHSYSFETKYKSDISSNIYFNDKKLVGSIEKEHIFGVQFHPEKKS